MNKDKKALSVITLATKGNIKEHRPYYAKHSGVLIDSSILLDFGEKEFLKNKPTAIFITHFHSDHACFVEEKIGPIECPVYAPCPFEKMPEVRVLKKPTQVNGFKILPISTVHSHKVLSQGYLVEGKGKRIFYSGDIVEIEKKHLNKLKKLDAVITEASFFRKGGMVRTIDSQRSGHMGIKELLELFRPYTNRIIFNHFGSWFMKDVREARKKIKALGDATLSAEVAYDGKEFMI